MDRDPPARQDCYPCVSGPPGGIWRQSGCIGSASLGARPAYAGTIRAGTKYRRTIDLGQAMNNGVCPRAGSRAGHATADNSCRPEGLGGQAGKCVRPTNAARQTSDPAGNDLRGHVFVRTKPLFRTCSIRARCVGKNDNALSPCRRISANWALASS